MTTKIRITRVSGDHNAAVHRGGDYQKHVGESSELKTLTSGDTSFDVDLATGDAVVVCEKGAALATDPNGAQYDVRKDASGVFVRASDGASLPAGSKVAEVKI